MSIVQPDVRSPFVVASQEAFAGTKVKQPDFVLSRARGKRVLDIGSIGAGNAMTPSCNLE